MYIYDIACHWAECVSSINSVCETVTEVCSIYLCVCDHHRPVCVITYAHTSCVSAHTATMGGRDFTVAEWKQLASALHYGALSMNIPFETTQSALEHLYQNPATSSSRSGELDHGRYRDYCYTHRNGPCPPTSECRLRLSTFFGVETNNRCVLCSGLTIQQTAKDFTYGVSTGQVFLEEPSEGESLSLAHMTHLAVYHTPFFVMLILGSVANKRYKFHTNATCRQELAATVFNNYKVNQESFHTGAEHDIAFLKMWWRYMNRHSSRTINVKIPYYLELPNNTVSQYNAWNPAYDRFADRRPEPIYTFIAKHCTCRDVWDESTTYNPRACEPTMRSECRDEGFTVHSLQTHVSKLHIEPILDSIATAHGPGGAAWAPHLRNLRVDTVIVEESGDPTLAVLHLVISLQSTWIPLETWLLSTGSATAEDRSKVALGILGHLTQMFEKNEIPPRSIYKTHSDLIKTFLVNAETRDVISLLPYLCMRKMYRAVNRATDEIELKKACCGIVAEALSSPGDSRTARELVDAWWSDGHSQSVPSPLDRYLVLCKQGLPSNSPIWTEQDCQTCSCAVRYGPAWSCEELENSEVKQKLVELGFVAPVRITIIELPRTEPLQHPEQTSDRTTKVPECFKGLAIALTVNTMVVIDDVSYQQQATYHPAASGKRLMTIDYENNQWQHDVGPVQPKISHVEPDPLPDSAADFRFGDTETDLTFFTHAIFGDDGTAWQSVQNSANMTYDSNLFNTDMLETMSSLDEDPAAASPGAIEALPDFNEAPLLIVPDAILRHIDYAVVDLEAWRVPWMESSSVSPSDQDATADVVEICDANRPYETDTRRNTIAIMNDRLHENNAEAEGHELDQGLAERDSTEHDAIAGSPSHDAGGPDNRAINRRPRQRGRSNRQQNGDIAHVQSHTSEYTSDQPQGRRVPTPTDYNLMTQYPKWRSNGVQYNALHDVYGEQYNPYHTLSFNTPLLWKTYDPTVALKPISNAPQINPSADLEPRCIHANRHSTDVVEGVCRTATNVSETNYKMGVEGSVKFGRSFSLPSNFTYNTLSVPSVTLDAKIGERTYYAVDLSKPPQRGFRHVHLIVNEFPLPNRPPGILEIVTSQALYLGHVLTVSNVEGLLLHRVFTEDLDVLDVVLDMHTSLQIHPFVPRTFAMELMMLPFTDTGITANFIGEHAGDWNLGSPDGLANMNDEQKCKLAYHVTLCLVKAQILTMTILGFPLLRLHPARIWRHGTGFRLDFLACLLDHITARLNSIPAALTTTRSINRERLDSDISPVAGGVRAITTALRLLGLDEVAHVTLDADCQETIDVFYNMYQELTGQDCSVLPHDSVLLTILGENSYEAFTVPTSDCRAEPFAPFYIQIHNQYVKWNKVVIVEPLRTEVTVPPQLHPHVGPPKVKYVKKKKPPSRDRLQPEAPVASASDEALAPESNATQSQIMLPPVQAARTPRARSRSNNSNCDRSYPNRRVIPPHDAARPSAQIARATRGRHRQPVTAPRATTSRATHQMSPDRAPEPTHSTTVLDDDYDMNTCGSTYYDG